MHKTLNGKPLRSQYPIFGKSTLMRAARLLELTRPFDLDWSRTEQRLVNRLLSEKFPGIGYMKKSLKVTDRRVMQLVQDVRKRLEPVVNAIESREFDHKNIRTWPIALLKLDADRDDRRLEKRLLVRHITMVVQLLGRDSPLGAPERRKGLGKIILGALEEKLKPYGLVGELAWKLPSPRDERRVWQDEIEKRIQSDPQLRI
jgi:hypothetical protein